MTKKVGTLAGTARPFKKRNTCMVCHFDFAPLETVQLPNRSNDLVICQDCIQELKDLNDETTNKG